MRHLKFVCLLPVLLSLSSGASAATAGVLTSAEYQTVVSDVEQIAHVNSRSAIAKLRSAEAGCRRQSAAGPLLRAERTNCVADVQTLLSERLVYQAEQACKSRGTLDGRMNCLLPGYLRMRSGFTALHREGVALDRTILARHFTKECSAALGDLPRAVTDEKVLARDLSILVSMLRSHDATGFLKETGRFITASGSLVGDSSKVPPLTLCPHA